MNLTTAYQHTEDDSCCAPNVSLSTCRNKDIQNCNLSSTWSRQETLNHSGNVGVLYHLSRERGVKQLNELMAKEVMELPFEERNRIAEQMHGIATERIEESPDFVARRLEAMEREIQKIPSDARAAVDCARRLDKTYVDDRAFRLMFLRSEEFHPEKAAARFARHFEYKLELFGQDKLVKRITYDDLDEEDRKCVSCGYFQTLGCKDVAGRTIVHMCANLMAFATWENLIRAMWYLTMVMLEDESTQRNGIVVIFLGFPGNAFRHGYGKKNYILQGVPVRIVATHFCCVGQTLNPVLRYYFVYYGRDFRKRIRIVLEDTFIQVLYALQSHGIDPESVPCRLDGTPHADKLSDVVNAQIAKEKELTRRALTRPDTTTRAVAATNSLRPLDSDILLKQGPRYRCQKGNILLDDLIDKRMRSYLVEATSFGKTCVVASIVQDMKESGSRFLQFDKSTEEWVIVDDPTAHKLVCARFRNKIRARNHSKIK